MAGINKYCFWTLLFPVLLLASTFSYGQDTADESSDGTTYVTEEEPEFPGGEEALFKYIRNEVQYPDAATEEGIEGTVVVKFDVNKEGAIVNDSIQKSVSKSLDQEALRVVRSMPDWNPGTQQGDSVKVTMYLPIRFSLGEADDEDEK